MDGSSTPSSGQAPVKWTIAALDQSLVLSDGTLTLTSGSSDLQLGPLLIAYKNGQPLVISDAKKQTTADAVTVSGTASFMRVPALQVTAVFTLDAAQNPAATFRFT